MKNHTKIMKCTNKVLAGLAFEGSPLGTIAGLMQQTKKDFDFMIGKINLLLSERGTLA